jgi:hypothetical protein
VLVLVVLLALELVLVASSASIDHLAASGSTWHHLEASGSWVASGGIWDPPAASASIWHHLAASGSIWHHLGCLAERSKLCRLEIEPWAGNQALVARIKDFGGFPTSEEDTFIFVGGPGCVQNVKI